MRISQAEKLCPAAQFVPAREELIHIAHDTLVAAIRPFTPTLETASSGLLYAEVSGLRQRFGPDTRLAHQIAQKAGRLSGLDVQVGVGNSKFVAEQAVRASRPGTGCAVPPGEERAFLSPLPITALPTDSPDGLQVPGMGRRLHLLGVRTLGALAALPRLAVVRQFGPPAGPLHDLACGIDPRPVYPDAPPLVLKCMRAFDDPLSDRASLLAYVDRMAEQLAESLSHHAHHAEGIRLCLKGENGEEYTAGMLVKPPSAALEKLSRLAGRLLGELSPAGPAAFLSITVYPLRPFHLGATQLTMFANSPDGLAGFSPGPQDKRWQRLRETLRRLRERFGEMIIVVASLIAPPSPRPILVTTNPAGQPRALVLQDRIRRIEAIYEAWRERRYWWSQPVERDYYRLETDDGQMRVIYRDTRAERWLLERRHV
jgi:nucleotidyltransferase/DNA polymerase involved in DNA repair